ncbi:MAG: hypothetical protein H8D45_29085 [Bacteroidetes bacterium]|nr:hypothetical protein [Bacteroidota bacterium]
MKKPNLILFCLFIVAVLATVAYTSSIITAKHYKAINIAEQKQSIMDKNTFKKKAKIENDNKQAIIDSLELVENIKFKYIYAEPPKTDEDITPVDILEKFVPEIDIGQIIENFIKSDTRTATTVYEYRDKENNYGADVLITLPYRTGKYDFKQLNVIFNPKKRYPFAVGIYLTTNESIGSWIDYDLWRVRFGVSAGVSTKMELEGRVDLGFKM